MDDDIKALKPYATSVTWRSDNGGSWQQWHDESDPMPDQWEGRPPDEVVNVYSADQLARVLDRLEAAEADAARYRWLRELPNADSLNVRFMGCDLDMVIDAAMQAKEPPP